MRTLVIPAAALAAAIAVPGVSRAGSESRALQTAPAAVSAGERAGFGLRRGAGGRGLMLRQPVTSRSALAVTLSSGARKELPEVRVILGLLYFF